MPDLLPPPQSAPTSPPAATVPARHAVTVVVATRDRAADLRASLPRHAAPVVVVDNGSTDGSLEVVRAEAERRREAGEPELLLLQPGRNLGATARNLGVEAARTPLVAFADDDSWWAPGSLERAAGFFAASPRLALLAARLLVGDAEELDPVCAQMAAAPWGRAGDLPGPDVLGFVACGSVVRRDAFCAVGGFDDVNFFAGEEERVAYDLTGAGWGMAYVPDVVAHHHPSPARSAPAVRAQRIHRNVVLTAWMRRPLPSAVRSTAWRVAAGGPERAGALEALGMLPRALRLRRVNAPEVERRLRVLAALGGGVA
ncbi:glycosyltransferase family 2 protein [Kineococcus glutinatus]|uniref:Glycosyltransferase n=1 Tax=Kineococcus glutinatus TaxID=1070872 RepID=A0ABP8VC14_9ACTN